MAEEAKPEAVEAPVQQGDEAERAPALGQDPTEPVETSTLPADETGDETLNKPAGGEAGTEDGTAHNEETGPAEAKENGGEAVPASAEAVEAASAGEPQPEKCTPEATATQETPAPTAPPTEPPPEVVENERAATASRENEAPADTIEPEAVPMEADPEDEPGSEMAMNAPGIAHAADETKETAPADGETAGGAGADDGEAAALVETTEAPGLAEQEGSGADVVMNEGGNDHDEELMPPPEPVEAGEPSDAVMAGTPRSGEDLAATMKKCLDVVNQLFALEEAESFREPVDVETLQIFDYYEKVKCPMDLGTIRRRINYKSYSSSHAVLKDVRLVFANCRKYNGKNSPLTAAADTCEAAFNELWTAAGFDIPRSAAEMKRKQLEAARAAKAEKAAQTPKPRVAQAKTPVPVSSPKPVDVMDRCKRVVEYLINHRLSADFRAPVDAEGLGLNDYHTLITEPMDLGTIWGRINSDYYSDDAAVMRDVRLVWENCRTYNVDPMSPIRQVCDKLEQVFETRWVSEGLLLEKVRVRGQGVTKDIVETPRSSGRTSKTPASKVKSLSKTEATPPGRSLREPKSTRTRNASPGGQFAQASQAVQKLLGMPEAMWFRDPVEPEAMGLWDYLDIVKEPMDLGTVSSNIESGAYSFVEEVAIDVKLVWSNCKLYNKNAKEPVRLACDKLEKAFVAEWTKLGLPGLGMASRAALKGRKADAKSRSGDVPSKRKTDSEEKSASKKLKGAGKNGEAEDELSPEEALEKCLSLVDYLLTLPEAESFKKPMTFKGGAAAKYKAAVKFPMDLGTIRKMLRQGNYPSADHVIADMRLIWRNCERYSKISESVINDAMELEKASEYQWFKLGLQTPAVGR